MFAMVDWWWWQWQERPAQVRAGKAGQDRRDINNTRTVAGSVISQSEMGYNNLQIRYEFCAGGKEETL